MIGETVIFIENFSFNGRFYPKGTKMKVIGSSGMRGLDLEDENGNKILETDFSSHKYRTISEIREEQLFKLGIK